MNAANCMNPRTSLCVSTLIGIFNLMKCKSFTLFLLNKISFTYENIQSVTHHLSPNDVSKTISLVSWRSHLHNANAS